MTRSWSDKHVRLAVRHLFDEVTELHKYRELGMELEDIICCEIKKDFGHLLSGPRLPSAGETSAVSYLTPKTAALCFDRVYSWFAHWPESVGFWGSSPHELSFSLFMCLARVLDSISHCPRAPSVVTEVIQDDSFGALIAAAAVWSPERGDSEASTRTSFGAGLNDMGTSVARGLADLLWAKHGVAATPVYASVDARDRDYVRGDHASVCTSLAKLKVVDEEHLTWRQVLSFRSDEEARKNYRRLIHWLDAEMVGKSQSFIEDEIAIRLEDYEAALKKHGIATVLGVIEGLLDPKFIATAGTGGFLGWLASGGVGAALAAGAVTVGKVAVKVAEHLLRHEDVHGQHNEIAWLYEAKKKLIA